MDDIEIGLIVDYLPGGSDCFNFSAFSLSVITNVYKNLEHLTLNLTLSGFFFILTDLASFLLAFSKKSLISLISRGWKKKSKVN